MTMIKLAIIVTTPPHHNNTATAIAYTKQALLNSDVEVLGVFFYQNGVLNASQHLSMPSDELQAIDAWKELNNKYQLPIHLCITAGEKRGLTDLEESALISSNFTISGLGELVSLTSQADRVIQL